MYICQAAAGIHLRLIFDKDEFPIQTVTENKPLSEINKKYISLWLNLCYSIG